MNKKSLKDRRINKKSIIETAKPLVDELNNIEMRTQDAINKELKTGGGIIDQAIDAGTKPYVSLERKEQENPVTPKKAFPPIEHKDTVVKNLSEETANKIVSSLKATNGKIESNE